MCPRMDNRFAEVRRVSPPLVALAIVLTAVWLLSGKLPIAVACHALLNEPAQLVHVADSGVLAAVAALGTLGG